MKASISMVNWLNCIWSSDLHPHSKYLACYLRRYMNDFHDMAWPSLSTIQGETGLSRPTVVKYLADLEKNGWLVKDSSKHKSMTYIAVLPQRINQLVKELNQTSKGDLPALVNDVYPNKQSNKQENNNNVGDERQPNDHFDYEQVRVIWNQVCSASKSKSTKCNIFPDKGKAQIKKTYKAYCDYKKRNGKEPAERHTWCSDYFRAVLDFTSRFVGKEGEHQNWKPNLEYATRIRTYELVMEWFDEKRA